MNVTYKTQSANLVAGHAREHCVGSEVYVVVRHEFVISQLFLAEQGLIIHRLESIAKPFRDCLLQHSAGG